MSKEVVLDRIRKSINKEPVSADKASTSAKIEGWISGSRFQVRVPRGGSRNPALPVLRGTVEAVEGGAVVRASLGWATSSTGLAIVLPAAILVVIGLELAGYHIFSKEGRAGREVVIPLVFVLMFAVGWLTLGNLLAQPQADELSKWLKQVCSFNDSQ